ncbi:DUF1249 domain-containing protein [Porticoccaceae bacterium LTM1]|nr:DUF1249 domain-containing protein [Porticoccaceae bacterium LTM1]
MADCDANYLRLIKLFPDYQLASSRTFALPGRPARKMTATVLERTPYTTLMTLKQSKADGISWLTLPVMTVRLYHDARVAEVVFCEGQRSPFPRNDYPNDEMHQQDEKAQWGHFLAELLAHSLAHGYDLNYEPTSI